MKGKGRRKKDRRDQARPAQRKVPSAIRVEPVEPSSPLESMNSEEQEHVPFPFDDDTESMNSEEQEPVRFPFDDDTEDMNSDEEAEQWTNLKNRQAVALGHCHAGRSRHDVQSPRSRHDVQSQRGAFYYDDD